MPLAPTKSKQADLRGHTIVELMEAGKQEIFKGPEFLTGSPQEPELCQGSGWSQKGVGLL